MSLCNVGIMGTKYERTTAAPTTLHFDKNDSTQYVKIYHIEATPSIANKLVINVR